jgi:hypothetical protein
MSSTPIDQVLSMAEGASMNTRSTIEPSLSPPVSTSTEHEDAMRAECFYRAIVS